MNVVLPNLYYNALLCRYSEIAIKGRNRRMFERYLKRTIKRLLGVPGRYEVGQERGRIFVTPRTADTFSAEDVRRFRREMPRVFGLASSSPAFLLPPELSAIEQAVLDSFPLVYDAWVKELPSHQPLRYATRARRSHQGFPLTSTQLEIKLADDFLLPRFPRLKIDLDNPDLTMHIEVRKERAFLSYETIPGPGGLPSGTGGHVLALLSGGIDSPVACYQIMRRGCTMDFVTFHSAPYTPPGTVRKVAALVDALQQYQGQGRLIAVNLLPAQKAVKNRCSERLRTILYRRLMMRIADRIAEVFGAQAFVTGENLGQVASQTLANMSIIAQQARLPVLRPLVSFDKHEITAIGSRIGTYDISRQAMPDSCTVFAPTNPATAACSASVQHEEDRLDIPALVQECLDSAVTVDVHTYRETPLSKSETPSSEATS
ncbi:MAG: tRNA 4-thiouridine(8) synthase ThiI [Candidatus Pacebacteria bacterium]|nr:tRNA 4-thiouridine(8) synthase ThiI [Candidatus Paceibacterota bacterium]